MKQGHVLLHGDDDEIRTQALLIVLLADLDDDTPGPDEQ